MSEADGTSSDTGRMTREIAGAYGQGKITVSDEGLIEVRGSDPPSTEQQVRIDINLQGGVLVLDPVGVQALIDALESLRSALKSKTAEANR